MRGTPYPPRRSSPRKVLDFAVSGRAQARLKMRVESRVAARAGVFFVLAVTALTFRDLLSSDQFPAYRDLLSFFVPLKYYLAEQLKRGEIPLWNPFIQMGTPFLACWQTGVLYPPSLLLLLPFPLGFNLFLLAHYLVAAAGGWLFFRERDLSAIAASLGALTFVIGGFFVSLMNVTNHLQAAAWSPWILFAWARHRHRPSPAALAGLILALVLQVLGGSPEILLMTLVVVAASTANDTFPRLRNLVRLGAVFASVLALALGICAIQLLPSLEYLGESIRKGGLSDQEVMIWSLQPVSLLQLLLPQSWNAQLSGAEGWLPPVFEHQLPWIQTLYFGLVPLCLAIAGAASSRDRRVWVGLFVVATALALGRHTPFFPTAHALLPGIFGRFRFPEKFYFIVHLSTAVLAAEGMELVVKRERLPLRIASVAAATFVATASALLCLEWLRADAYLGLIAALRAGGLPADQLVRLAGDVSAKSERLVLILSTFAALLWLARRALIREATFGACLLALVAADLSAANHGINPTISWSKLMRQPLLIDREAETKNHYVFHYQTTAVLPTNGSPPAIPGFMQWFTPMRSRNLEENAIQLWRALYLNLGMIHEVPDIGGTDGMSRESLVKLQTVLSILPRQKAISLLRAYGVAYLIGPTALDVPGIQPIEQAESTIDHAYRITDPLPFAHFVSRLHVARSELEVFNLLIQPGFQPEEEAVVGDFPRGWENAPSGEPPAGIVESVSRQQSHLSVTVNAKRRGFLVLNDAYFPGWEARIDGAESAIYRTNVMARGLLVPPGRHVIDLVYRPASLRLGVAISLASGLLAAGLFTLATRRRESLSRVPPGAESRSGAAEET